jgi:hypothetical protein
MLRRAALLSGVSAAALSALAISAPGRTDSAVTDDAARRQHALARARVWFPPAAPISSANLSVNPADPRFKPDAIIRCRFEVKVVGGLTPKFPCTAEPDERLKVRYGASNAEIPAELAASRLLNALGFPTDPVYSVHAVECEGCPSFPFLALRCFRNVHAESACMPLRDRAQVRRFSPVLVERRYKGRVIEAFDDQGWRWDELDSINPKLGASRAEVDALRIMAVLLAHWDNKAENQRLICPDGAERDGTCERPIAMIADLGGSFGPVKAHLARWQTVRMWSDPRRCEVSLESLPWRGGTFPPRRITEEGRQLALRLLSQLSPRQLHALFAGAGFSNVPSWVDAFRGKVRQLQLAGPCPTD